MRAHILYTFDDDALAAAVGSSCVCRRCLALFLPKQQHVFFHYVTDCDFFWLLLLFTCPFFICSFTLATVFSAGGGQRRNERNSAGGAEKTK